MACASIRARGSSKAARTGPSVVTGKPAGSLLIKAVSYTDPGAQDASPVKLPDDQITTLKKWVETGAFWPDYGKSPAEAAAAGLWSVKPMHRPALPKTKNATWVRKPVDAFVLNRLEAKGMQPAPPAGKRELLRRLTFDLTGLPPTPEEIASFVSDKSPDAYEKRVDKLLASPQYGERWARYWLDLVRYADSNGYERDNEKPYSWKYRDYVIRSLNEDKPYNRFVTEQIAGDELPDRNESTFAATGFLRLGTWDDEPNDPLAYKYERLDDLVHATSTAFLGLTVRCARCHDHKFDPIPQKDYYAFAANFYAGYLEPGDGKLMGGPPRIDWASLFSGLRTGPRGTAPTPARQWGSQARGRSSRAGLSLARVLTEARSYAATADRKHNVATASARRLDRRPEEPTHIARYREPYLAAPFRPGTGPHTEQLRPQRQPPDPP